MCCIYTCIARAAELKVPETLLLPILQAENQASVPS